METYTPIPVDATPRLPRAVRVGGTVLLVAALLAVSVPVVRYTFQLDRPPDFYNYGFVHTPLGDAVVACGGEVTQGCGDQTALVFDSCATVFANFKDAFNPKVTDPVVRELIGKRAPSGSQWVVTCRSGGMSSDHLAVLEPN